MFVLIFLTSLFSVRAEPQDKPNPSFFFIQYKIALRSPQMNLQQGIAIGVAKPMKRDGPPVKDAADLFRHLF